MISRGARRSEIEFVGGVTIFFSFLLTLIFIGWKATLIQIPVFFFLVTPIVEVIISALYKKLYGASDEWIAKKYNTTVEDVRLHTYTYLNEGENAVVDKVTRDLLDKYNNK